MFRQIFFKTYHNKHVARKFNFNFISLQHSRKSKSLIQFSSFSTTNNNTEASTTTTTNVNNNDNNDNKNDKKSKNNKKTGFNRSMFYLTKSQRVYVGVVVASSVVAYIDSQYVGGFAWILSRVSASSLFVNSDSPTQIEYGLKIVSHLSQSQKGRRCIVENESLMTALFQLLLKTNSSSTATDEVKLTPNVHFQKLLSIFEHLTHDQSSLDTLLISNVDNLNFCTVIETLLAKYELSVPNLATLTKCLSNITTSKKLDNINLFVKSNGIHSIQSALTLSSPSCFQSRLVVFFKKKKSFILFF